MNTTSMAKLAAELASAAGLDLGLEARGLCGDGESAVKKTAFTSDYPSLDRFLNRIDSLQRQGFRASSIRYGPAYNQADNQGRIVTQFPEAIMVHLEIGHPAMKHYHPDMGDYKTPAYAPKVGREIPAGQLAAE